MSTSPQKLKVAILGCGQIADAHLSQLKRIDFADVVAVCDTYEDLAFQAAVRFQIPGQYTSLDCMLDEAQPDVVHVTTPAHTHAALTRQLLQRGCHVYVEKPFTLDAASTLEVLTQAELANREICVGHDQLFDPTWRRVKSWIRSGRIGEVRHVESILGYPISGSFGALVASNSDHWVRRLPGGLFQNTLSHPLYRITDLLSEEQPQILGDWSTRPEYDFPTEMQLSLQGRHQSASLTFSTQLPHQRITRIYGTAGTLEADFDAQIVRFCRRAKLPGAFAKLEMSCQQFWNATGNLSRNLWRFARSDIHYFAGMKELFERFYRTILFGESAPIPPSEIYRVTLLMDRIFEHCRERQASVPTAPFRPGLERDAFAEFAETSS